MQGHAACHVGIVVVHHHVPVHFGVYQAENHSLVAHQSLVVALDVGNRLFIGAAVGELPEDGRRMPVLVLFLLQGLDPVVRDTHGHAVVETDAAVGKGNGQAGHAAHFLGNGYGRGLELVNQDIGQGEIGDCVRVLTAIVVVAVAAEGLAQAVVIVEHRGHTVKAEAVEVVLLKPVLAVGQQEVEHLVFAIVKAQRVPCRVLAAPGVGVEIKVHRAVQTADALVLVLHGMGVHDVHNHGNSHAVGIVDELLEFLGSAEAARCSEKVAHVVAEGAVVRVLLDGHNLNGVVAVGMDTRQDAGAEFLVAANALFFLCHAYVALINQQGRHIGHELRVRPSEGAGRGMHLGREDGRLRVLHHAVGISRNAFARPSRPVNYHFIQLAIGHGIGRHGQFPHAGQATFNPVQLVGRTFFPTRKIAHQGYACGVWRPLAEGPAAILAAMQSEIFVSVGKVHQVAAAGGQLGKLACGVAVAPLDGGSIGVKPGVVFQ